MASTLGAAGGAMASVMLACYPEVFTGGAIIAGLPYGSAKTAFDRMRGYGMPSGRQLQKSLRDASPHQGPWPTISVWHGSADHHLPTLMPSSSNGGPFTDSMHVRPDPKWWMVIHGMSGAMLKDRS